MSSVAGPSTPGPQNRDPYAQDDVFGSVWGASGACFSWGIALYGQVWLTGRSGHDGQKGNSRAAGDVHRGHLDFGAVAGAAAAAGAELPSRGRSAQNAI